MLKQVFLAHFESVVTCIGPWKIPTVLENGSFWDQKRVKKGQKRGGIFGRHQEWDSHGYSTSPHPVPIPILQPPANPLVPCFTSLPQANR